MHFLVLEFAAVSFFLIGAYHLKKYVGLSAVVAVVASMQFLQAILGTSFYWEFGGGYLLSPGSCILFAGNLSILLYAFSRGGVREGREILYAILIANAVSIALSAVISLHIASSEPINYLGVPVEIFSQSLFAALFGIAALYIDEMLAVLLFFWLKRHLPKVHIAIPMTLALVATLSFDTFIYSTALFWDSSEFGNLLVSGLISKSLGGLAYGLVWGMYLQHRQTREKESVGEVLDILLFREDIEELREAASRDALTGLYNRHSYEKLVESIFDETSSAYGSPVALALVDIDYFKQVNDTLGHSRGDDILTAVADHLRDVIRTGDFVFRVGGDEFIVLLSDCELADARQVADRIGSFSYAHPRLDRPVTLTVGLAAQPDDGTTERELFEAADERLYAGKSRDPARAAAQASAPTE